MAGRIQGTGQAPATAFEAYYGNLTPKKATIIAVGLIAFYLNHNLRKEAYQQGYQHLPPSNERMALVQAAGVDLGLECAMVALLVSTLVYHFISCCNRIGR